MQCAASEIRLVELSCHLITSVSDHRRPPHSSSAPALLVATLPLAPAAADSTQHRYRSCRLILSPAHVLLLLSSALCVCTCVIAIQHPALGGCSACSGRYRRPLARPEPLSGLIAQHSLVCVMPSAMLEHLYVLITSMPAGAERRDAMRNMCFLFQ